MGHHIRGFIARADDLRRAARDLAGARVVPLALGFGFLPVTEQLGGEGDLSSCRHVIWGRTTAPGSSSSSIWTHHSKQRSMPRLHSTPRAIVQ